MHANIAISLDRADELLAELMAEYNTSLQAKEVSGRAIQLTHEVCERLRSVLDRIARSYWDKCVAPNLSIEDRKTATVYFPISAERNGFDSTLGRWRWKATRPHHQDIYDIFLDLQPFTNKTNRWLMILNDLAVQGKHIDLVPQKRIEAHQNTVASKRGGSISWSPGVVFSPGISIMGAPINASTQRIIPTPGISQTTEIWVSFIIQGYDVNAIEFCKHACRNARLTATHISDRFDL